MSPHGPRLCRRPPAEAESRPGVWPDGPTRRDAALPAAAMEGMETEQGGFRAAPPGMERASHAQPAWAREPGGSCYP